ncbi:MAG: DNA polymerase III subunit delta [Clostridia bacterium]
MPKFDEKQLKAHIKTKEFKSAYLIYGDESYLKQLYANTICDKCLGDTFKDMNFDKFDGKETDLQKILQTADLMPFMAEKRCILVEDFKLESMPEKDHKTMKTYFENLPQSTVLIFVERKNNLSLRTAKKAIELFDKYGAVCVLNKRTGKDLINPLISSAKKKGLVLSPQMANYLVTVVGDDFNVLINELSKVCSYAQTGEITKKHIDEVAVKSLDTKISYLIRALLAKNFEKAYEVLDTLLRQKTEPEYILGSITSGFVDMYRAKVSVLCGDRAEALKDDFNYKNRVFALTNGARDSSRMDISDLRRCLEAIAQADFKLKNTAQASNIVIEQLLVQLMLISNGERV